MPFSIKTLFNSFDVENVATKIKYKLSDRYTLVVTEIDEDKSKLQIIDETGKVVEKDSRSYFRNLPAFKDKILEAISDSEVFEKLNHKEVVELSNIVNHQISIELEKALSVVQMVAI